MRIGAFAAIAVVVSLLGQQAVAVTAIQGMNNERAIDNAVRNALGKGLLIPIGTPRPTAPLHQRNRILPLREPSLPACSIPLREVPVSRDMDNNIVRDHGTGAADREMIVAPAAPVCGSGNAR